MRIVDAHTHLGLREFIVRPISEEKLKKPSFQDKTTQTIEELIASMDRNDVERAVVFPFPLAEVDPELANGYVMQAWSRYPGRIIPFALLDDRPEYWIDQGFRGFKQHFLLEPERFQLGRVYPVIAAAGLPLMAHFPTFRIVECALEVLGHAPDIKLIIAHFGRCKPDTGDCVAGNIDRLCAYPHVFFESSTVKDASVLAAAIRRVGVDRVCFGSDLPFGSKDSDNPQAVELEVIRAVVGNEPGLDRVLSGTILGLVGEH